MGRHRSAARHLTLADKNEPPRQADVLVGYPCHGQVEAMFAYDLARLVGYSVGNGMGPGRPLDTLRIMAKNGTLIADQRYDIASSAVRLGASHILWLDADMRFPKDTLTRLLAHDKEIVGASYCKRREPLGTVAFNGIHGEPPYKVVYTYPFSTGLEKVDRVGFGCLLTRTSALKKMEEPWFPMIWGRDSEGRFGLDGEDTSFFRLAHTAGVECWIDHDLSKEVKHIGVREYTHEDAVADKVAMRKDPGFYVEETPEPPAPAGPKLEA